MIELRVHVAGADYQVDMSVEEFEEKLKSDTNDFIRLKCLLFGKQNIIVQVRPSQIPYYYLQERN